jgi:hypothetical protein
MILAKSTYSKLTYDEKDFLSDSFDFIFEEIENAESVLTKDGLYFFQKAYGIEKLMKTLEVDQRQKTSFLKWFMCLDQKSRGIDGLVLQKINDKFVSPLVEKLKAKDLGKNLINNKIFTLKVSTDPIELVAFLHSLDSEESVLNNDGKEFLLKLMTEDFLTLYLPAIKNSTFELYYKAPNEIVEWIKNDAKFDFNRYESLIKKLEEKISK